MFFLLICVLNSNICLNFTSFLWYLSFKRNGMNENLNPKLFAYSSANTSQDYEPERRFLLLRPPPSSLLNLMTALYTFPFFLVSSSVILAG